MFGKKKKMMGSSVPLLEKLLERGVAIRVLLHDLGDGHLKVLLVDVHTSLTQGVHTSLGTDSLHLSTRSAMHELSNTLEVDTTGEVHATRVDLEDIETGLLTRVGELDLAVDTAGTEEGRVEDVDSVGGHEDLDVLCRLKSIELVQQLQHGALHFTVSTHGTLHTC